MKTKLTGGIAALVLIALTIFTSLTVQDIKQVLQETINVYDSLTGIVVEVETGEEEIISETSNPAVTVDDIIAIDQWVEGTTSNNGGAYFRQSCDNNNYDEYVIFEDRKNPWSDENPAPTGPEFTERVGKRVDFGENVNNAYICVTLDHSSPITKSNLYLAMAFFNEDGYNLIGGHHVQNITHEELPYSVALPAAQSFTTVKRLHNMDDESAREQTTYLDAFNNGKVQVIPMYNSTQRGKMTTKVYVSRK